MDENDIEEIENDQPEEKPIKKIMKKKSKKKEANIKRSLILQKKKEFKMKKINKLKKNPKTLQKFLLNEKRKRLERLQQKTGNRTKPLKLKEPQINDDAVKSNVEVKIGLQHDSSNNVKGKKKVKKSVDKSKISKEEKFVESNLENTGKVKVLKPNKVDKNLRKKNNAVQKKSKSISSPQAVEKNLKKEDPWEEPLKEGEIEFNVTKKKYSKKVKSGMLMVSV